MPAGPLGETRLHRLEVSFRDQERATERRRAARGSA
jgi:hypothetical protein